MKLTGEKRQEIRDGGREIKEDRLACFDILLVPGGTKHVWVLQLPCLLLGDETLVPVNEI